MKRAHETLNAALSHIGRGHEFIVGDLITIAIRELRNPFLVDFETPEQWETRTGKKWEDAVYFNLFSKKDGHSVYIGGKYQTMTIETALEIIDKLENQQHCHEYTAVVICANNDNGRPPDGWKPEGER